jgi:anti-sigma regulatory factor (Ser/Thr protein kinase)
MPSKAKTGWSGMSMQEARVMFQPEATAPAMGRRVLDALTDGIPPSVLDDARLLLTELLTNAIQHAQLSRDDRISVAVRREPAGLLVEVSDCGNGLPPAHARGPGSTSGWGLLLLDRLADEWGIETRAEGGTLAWFRLALRAR